MRWPRENRIVSRRPDATFFAVGARSGNFAKFVAGSINSSGACRFSFGTQCRSKRFSPCRRLSCGQEDGVAMSRGDELRKHAEDAGRRAALADSAAERILLQEIQAR